MVPLSEVSSTVQLLGVWVNVHLYLCLWFRTGDTRSITVYHSRYALPLLHRIPHLPLPSALAIYHLYEDGTTGHRLHQVDHNMVTPGLYIILDDSTYKSHR